jgi:nucleoside-diphosphate-sugar epimerase
MVNLIVKSKFLITGATGFIGTHLVKFLVKKGYDIKCLVRKNSDVSFLNNLKVELVYGDLLNSDSLKDIARDVEVVYHLAAVVNSKLRNDPISFNNVIIKGTKNLVNECLKHKVKKFIYFSSIAAIGIRNSKKLVDETIECIPNTSYGKAKLAAENILLKEFKSNNFPVVIIRPPTIYGPGDRYGFLNLTQSVINKSVYHKSFIIIGNGNNLTSLCYVNNLVEASFLISKNGIVGEIYHVSDNHPYKLKDPIETIARTMNLKVNFHHVSKNVARIISILLEPFKIMGLNVPLSRYRFIELTSNFALDINKIKSLGYKPKNNFLELVKETVEDYKNKGLI